MASPERIQIDDHFAAAKRRAAAPPARTIGAGRAVALLTLLAGAIAGTWWWALQPTAAAALPPTPALTTVADRQAAVAAGLTDEPRRGGETHEQYEARLARIRANLDAQAARGDAPAVDAQRQGGVDRGPAGRPAPTGGLPGAGSVPPARPVPPAPLAVPDHGALTLAGRVNERRQERAVHLRWLDACEKQHLVDLARARIAQAHDSTAARNAQVAAQNLAADIDTHQREARRVDGLLATAEQRLVDYCAEHGQQLPALDSPSETVSGLAAQPRPMPVATTGATIRPAQGTAAPRRANLDPFAGPAP